jgi:hypothetical protein
MVKIFVLETYRDKYGEVTLFLDESMDLLGCVCSDDARWRGEYFEPIFTKAGVKVCDVDKGEVPDLDNKLEEYWGF